jgi:hypothetical protein
VATKPRLANNTIAALEDIHALCMDAWTALQAACERAERDMDPVMLAKLNRVLAAVAMIDRKATQARQGKYEQ